ncbi:hypothetical protein NVP1121O_222 [Vibrio phage 1.121.O._10N.286.46.C4]|nr:hypothetical protein NVP1121O_222 [Vibrio phage 1.121.O._10N.286.46.C4]
MIDRFECTVSDKRGYKGKAMRKHLEGDYVRASDYDDQVRKVRRMEKKESRRREGTIKLLQKINSGGTVVIDKHTISWLEACGFNLVVEPSVYNGNLPLEDRVEYFRVRLDNDLLAN